MRLQPYHNLNKKIAHELTLQLSAPVYASVVAVLMDGTSSRVWKLFSNSGIYAFIGVHQYFNDL